VGNSLTSRNYKRSGADVIDFIEESQPKNAKNGKNNERKYCLRGKFIAILGKSRNISWEVSYALTSRSYERSGTDIID
jgi:hypothetical protein